MASLLSWVMKVVRDNWSELKRHSVACHGCRQDQRKLYLPVVSSVHFVDFGVHRSLEELR